METDSSIKINVNEVYPCIQGEGKYAGVPHILIRMSGCALRCQFANSICDTPYSSWAPEKSQFTVETISQVYEENPKIKYTMITGGGPTLNPYTLALLTLMAKVAGHFVTIETEGSEFVKTGADFISLSPKLSNSTPSEGVYNMGLVGGDENKNITITKEQVAKHELLRKNYSAMIKMIRYHKDYQLKPVICNLEQDMPEVQYIQRQLQVPNNKVYLMPEGINEEQLNKSRKEIIEYAIKEGYNYTDRLHIIAYGPKRGV